MEGWMDGCCVNKGGRGCGGGRSASPQCEPSIDSIWENTGLCGFGCLVCWLLGGLPMQSKYRQHLGKTFGCLVCLLLGLPTLSVLLSFLWLVCWLVRPAWLVVCLDFVCLLVALVAWFVGCLVGCWLGCVVAWLVGRLVGTPLMAG